MIKTHNIKKQTMEELLKIQKAAPPKVGDIVEGVISSIQTNEIVIDIPSFGAGVVMGPECWGNKRALAKLKAGDKVKAEVVGEENEDGYVELSFYKAFRKQVWDKLKRIMKEEKIIKTRVLDANKGGLILEIEGVIGFLPVSQLSTKYYPRVENGSKDKILAKLKTYIGKEFPAKIIDLAEEEEKLIVSEKEARSKEEEKELDKLKVGDHIKGKASGIVDFGIFVRFGSNLEGLVHISEIDWSKIENPRDFAKTGDTIEAEVIGIEDHRISLSIKKLKTDPWVKASAKYKVEDKVKGKITKISPFGLFVKLDEDIQGLAHISELVKDPRKQDINKLFKIGEEKEFKIISIVPEEHRLGLSTLALKESKKDREDAFKKDKKSVKPKSKKVSKTRKDKEPEKSGKNATKKN